MKRCLPLSLSLTLVFFIAAPMVWAKCPDFLQHEMRRLHSSKVLNLCKVSQGRPLLIVNTASHCGFTPQYAGLEELHNTYEQRGLVVLGFASNSFNQETRNEAESARICRKNFGVSFTMLAATAVKGNAANPVFIELNRQAGAPTWNFNKYLVTADGEVIDRFSSSVRPGSSEIKNAIEALLERHATRSATASF